MKASPTRAAGVIGVIACFTLAPGIPAPGYAATLKVPQDFATVQAAVDVALTGDVIAVGKGTHAGFVVDGKTGLTIKGKGKPVIDGNAGFDPVVAIRNADGVVLDGLIVQNAADRLIHVTGSQNVTIRRCTIADSASDGIRADASVNVLIEKNFLTRIDNDAVDFTDDGFGPAVGSHVVKNKFETIDDDALELQGTGHRIEKNSIADIDDAGIVVEVPASGITISKNKITDTDDSAIDVEGTDHVIEKNTATDVDDEGIHVRGNRTRVEKNKVDGAGDDGIDLEGADNVVLKNTIKNTGGNGLEIGEIGSDIEAVGNLFEGNKVTGAAENGFDVRDGLNTFRGNKAAKSGGFGLLDESGAGTNVYEKNKFGTEQIL
jgi:hypothetical protein